MAPDLTIERVDVTPIDIPLTDEFVISRGRIDVAQNAFVSVTLRCGATGWGEIAPFPALTGETREASVAAVERLRELCIGRDASRVHSFAADLAAEAAEAAAARSGIECATADAHARALGVPLWELWGASAVRAYETDITLPILEESRIDALAAGWYARGFRIYKMKAGTDPDAEVARVRRLAAAHPDVTFVLDANQGFDAQQAIGFLDGLGEVIERVALLEQPVAAGDLDGMAKIHGDRRVAVAADESVFTRADARAVIEAGAADVINLKIMKAGLVEALAIAELARAAGLGLMVGGMVETRLAMSFSLAMALGTGGIRHFDLDTPLLLERDPLRGGYRYDGPRMLPWHEPGVGAVPAGL